MITVKIEDDFDLARIAESGQCFRVKEIQPGLFRFISLNHVLYIKKVDENFYECSCDNVEWERFWKLYFDLETNYAEIREHLGHFATEKTFEDFVVKAMEFSKGIRILHQDPFETLISFIISQRKSIPAIKKSVELICDNLGEILRTQYGDVRMFPTPEVLCKATILNLSSFAVGYRAPYIRDAVDKVTARIVRLDDMNYAADTEILQDLQTIMGVGAKISSCVALYGYHRMNVVPIDVWIQRTIEEDFHGRNVFAEIGNNAGILQQYIYFYKRMGDKEFWLVG